MTKNTKKYLFTGLCIFLFHFSNAQIVNNQLNLYFSYGLAVPKGGENVQEKSFVNPAFLANMQQGQAFSVAGTYQLKPFLSTGLAIDYSEFSDWKHPEGSEKYEGAGMQILSVSPIIRIHTKAEKQGFFNRVRLFAECDPGFSHVKTTLSNPIFDVQLADIPDGFPVDTPKSSKKLLLGVQGVLGSELVLGDGWGAAVRLGYHHLWAEDVLYTEKSLSFLTLQAGVFFRLMHDKRFFY